VLYQNVPTADKPKSHNGYREQIERLLEPCDVRINGDRPFDIQVHDERLYARVLAQGSLGFGEAYMDGWWNCEQIDEAICRIMRVGVDSAVRPWHDITRVLMARLVNMQTKRRAYEVGRRHYDIGNTLYERMLGRYMVYSCGYWARADNLDDAQYDKMDLIARKLGLEPGMRVLDIGCGWGELARFMAAEYGAEVVGVTISREQAEYGQRLCQGVPAEIRLQDYRDVSGTFDRIVSVGMFEHVGYNNYRVFMETCARLLPSDGLLLLHTIGNNITTATTDPWIERYIFPNSMLPSAAQVTEAADEVMVLEDWHNFGTHYDLTLRSWFANFDAHWSELADDYGERFYRMWRYYLLSCAGSFRARKNHLWQLVLSPYGRPGGYVAPR